MAIHTKKEFAALCGFSTRELSVYIRRKKVVLTGKNIDDSLEQNRDFLDKRRGLEPPAPKPELQKELEKKLRMIRPDAGGEDGDEEDYSADIRDDNDGSGETGYQLNQKKLKRTIEKLEVDIRLSLLKEQVMRGELVPVDTVRALLKGLTHSVITSFKDGLEDQAINIAGEARLRGDQLAKIRSQNTAMLNSYMDKAVVMTQNNLRIIINQIKVKRNAGERK